ncbi:MAG TPA: citrate synthase [Blastocatellia bacterium]|jgi:citrate synthase|nr:citrate synthase [Blastocatellia bacterium]
MSSEANVAKAGLEGVVAGESSISDVNGLEGRLIYAGYDIHDLAQHSTFEEVIYLLWNLELPTRSELEELKHQLGRESGLPAQVQDLIRSVLKGANPMDMLRTVVSALSFYDPDGADMSREANVRKAIRLTAKFPTIVTTFQRLRNGQDPVEPREDLSLAGNFLYTLRGEEPDDVATRTMDMAFVLHADHELNASTFAARVTAATLSDMYSAIVSAIGTLKGPLHGGANEGVIKNLLEIGSVDNVEAWTKDALVNKKKIMGFGHRVYRTEDPRATHLREMSRQLGERTGEKKWYEMSRKMEEVMMREKSLNPNVDFYSASTYYALGLPTDLFTPIFACSRVSGWTAHVLEQYKNNRLIRPRAEYVGPRGLKYKPVEQRG